MNPCCGRLGENEIQKKVSCMTSFYEAQEYTKQIYKTEVRMVFAWGCGKTTRIFMLK